MMEHGARRRCTCCRTKSDGEKAIEFMEAYVLARASALKEDINLTGVLKGAKDAYITIHTTNIEAIRKEMNKNEAI